MDLTSLKIRKIIAGNDPLKAIAIVVGQRPTDGFIVTDIELDERHLLKYGERQYMVYIQKEGGDTFVWKTITAMPVIVEYDCNF